MPADRQLPVRSEIESVLSGRSNWGRWGDDDQVGAVNLITAEKRVQAAGLVRSGRTLSLSRPFPVEPAANNLHPAQQYMKTVDKGGGYGAAVDYYGISYHGLSCTHLDALCHVWGPSGMWNGRQPAAEVGFAGASWGDVAQWRHGITTRGVFIDIPRHRGVDFVAEGEPVHGDELEAIVSEQGASLSSGDALVIYCGRDAYDATNGMPWGSETQRPGLHASCLEFIRDCDCAAIAWDMQDEVPNEYGYPWTAHQSIFAFGVAVVDHCELGALARACREEGRSEFMFVVAPLLVEGGTGSPVNPLAIF